VRESKIEAHLRKRVLALGGLCWKVVSPGMIGVPDRVVLMPNCVAVWVELKAPGQLLRAAQQRRHVELWTRGHRVVALDSIEAVDKFMEQFE